MRKLFLSAAVAALLAACSPPASQDTAEKPDAPPMVAACNSVTPDVTKQVRIQDERAVAAAASELRGGAITPGTYDLAQAMRIGDATGWQGTRAVSLDVSEDSSGTVIFNWAGTTPNGQLDTWTATFADSTPQARLSYTCGRIGEVDANFAAEPNALQLRLRDGANGSLQLEFERRG